MITAGKTVISDKIPKVRYDVLICLFLVISTLTVYWQIRDYDFVNFDDNLYVIENYHVQEGLTIKNLKWAFSFTEKDTYWQPLTWLSHMLDCQLYGLNPGMHHSTNLILHIVNSILLFLIFLRMTGEVWKSGFVAALFALHPINVESVAWIAERKNVLSTLFWMLTLLAYSLYTEKPDRGRYLATLSIFTMGLLAKPFLVTLPFVLLLLDYWPLKRFRFEQSKDVSTALRLILEKIPFFVLSIASVCLSSLSLQHFRNVISTETVPISLRISNAMISYVKYIGKMIWPHNLVFYYPYPKMVPAWQILGSILFLICVSILILWFFRRIPYLSIGWLWYLGTMVPVIGLMQAGLWPAMADRWAYVPLIGIYIIIAWGIPEFFVQRRLRKNVLVPATVVLFSVLMATTNFQVRHWANNMTLYEHALHVNSDNAVAHINLGIHLLESGKVDEATRHYVEALRINPDFEEAHYNMGIALSAQGKLDEAINHYAEALRIKPDYWEAFNNMGVALTKKEKFDEAIAHFQQALEKMPHKDGMVENYTQKNLKRALAIREKIDKAVLKKRETLEINLGAVFEQQGSIEEAVIQYDNVLHINPENEDAHNHMGHILAAQGKTEEAYRHFVEALRLNPRHAEAHNNMGMIMAGKKRIGDAIRHFNEALRIKPDFIDARHNLGVALAEQGRIKEAENSFREVLRIDSGYEESRKYLENVMAIQEEIDTEIAEVQNLLKMNRDDPELYYRLGNLYRRKGETDKAIEQYHKALSIQPEFVPGMNSLGIAYAIEGKYEKALSLFEKIIKLQPDHADAYYFVATIYAKQQKTEESVNWLKKAIAKGFKNWDRIKTDSNLDNIRSSSGYKILIKDH